MAKYEAKVDIVGEMVDETDDAIKWDDGDRLVWLPKSQIEINEDGTCTVPQWLAFREGLI